MFGSVTFGPPLGWPNDDEKHPDGTWCSTQDPCPKQSSATPALPPRSSATAVPAAASPLAAALATPIRS
ncbi:MAG: hypothetical protein AAFU77_08830 [Myxococcota bacterium]